MFDAVVPGNTSSESNRSRTTAPTAGALLRDRSTSSRSDLSSGSGDLSVLDSSLLPHGQRTSAFSLESPNVVARSRFDSYDHPDGCPRCRTGRRKTSRQPHGGPDRGCFACECRPRSPPRHLRVGLRGGHTRGWLRPGGPRQPTRSPAALCAGRHRRAARGCGRRTPCPRRSRRRARRHPPGRSWRWTPTVSSSVDGGGPPERRCSAACPPSADGRGLFRDVRPGRGECRRRTAFSRSGSGA